MLRLKSFLHASEEELALRKVVSILVEKIGSVSVKGVGDDYAEYCSEMNQFRDRISNEDSPALLFIWAGAAVQAMEDYNLKISILRRNLCVGR